MVADVILDKCSIIERCLVRIAQEYEGDPQNLRNQTKQDSIVLNVQRAVEASIDLALHLVRTRRLGVPQRSRDAFDLLMDANLLDQELGERLMAMVGFRNIGVDDHRKLDLVIIEAIVERHLEDLRELVSIAPRTS